MESDPNAFDQEPPSEPPHQQPAWIVMSPDPASMLSKLPTRLSFGPGVVEKIGSYVYLLIDPRTNTVFYVGKGTGNRCFAHLAEAGKTLKDAAGDYPKLNRIREIEASGEAVQIDILRHGLSDHEALLVESAAIDLLDDLTNEVVGHGAIDRGRLPVSEVNIKYGAKPVEIDPAHCVVLIRINETFQLGMTDDALYEATRKWWKIRATKRQLGSPAAPRWAMAVFRGIVRAVYRIEAWEQPPKDYLVDYPADAGRWGFRGTRDLAMESKYLYRDVSSYLTSQFPLRYPNCAESGKNPADV